MIVFWAIAALLLVISLGLLLPALLNPGTALTLSTQQQKLDLYQQQLVELQQDETAGVLALSQLDAARNELQRRLLQEASIAQAAQSFVPDKRLAWFLLLALPVVAVSVYQRIGNPAAIAAVASSADVVNHADDQKLAEIESILTSLREKLEQAPDDAAGWALLARSYGKLHRYDVAIDSFEHAEKLNPYDAQLLADYALVLAMANQRKIQGKPEQLLLKALSIDPHQPSALMLEASAAYERKDYKTAISLWERLQPDLEIGSAFAASVHDSLAKARAALQEQAAAVQP